MAFTYVKKEDRRGPFIEITGYEGEMTYLQVPDEIEGLPVKSIGKFALAGRNDLREISLPRSVKTLGLFAFQNCMHLGRICLYNTTDDYYDGVIRSCDSLAEVVVHMVLPDNYIIIREILQDTDNALSFVLEDEAQEDGETPGKAGEPADGPTEEPAGEKVMRLTFPEYVREAREDTMARAIHFSIEGAGMAYRECVSKRALDLAGYDRLLPRLTEYDFQSAAEISLDRLMYPVKLAGSAREMYEEYLRAHTEKLLSYLVGRGDAERIRFLTGRKIPDPEKLDAALQEASRQGLPEICGILMAYAGEAGAHKDGGGAAGFSLDDW